MKPLSSTPIHPESYADFMTREELERIQLDRLQAVVRLAYDRVDLTRNRMRDRGMTPGDIRSLDDVRRLPFMEKSDLRDGYPYALFAQPMRDIVRLHASSGTTGKPIVVGYTREDLKVWTQVMMRTLAAAGVHEGDIVQNAYGYGLFTGGLGAHYGAEALGATVIPISGGNTERQIMVMRDFGVTVFLSTPSYFVHLLEVLERSGCDPRELKLRTGVFGAEPWSDGMRAHIEARAGIRAYDIYGLSEIIGPGVAAECAHQQGLHVFEDHFLTEIVDPATGDVVPDGEEGELVLTTLSKQAIPMIRYRTHDITTIIPEPCPCGRTIRRIRRIGRRSDDMLIIRGVNIYPAQIEAALLQVDRNLPHYQLILTRREGLDELEVQVEVTERMFHDEVSAMGRLEKRLAQAIEHVAGLRVDVRLVEPQSIARSQGKAKRVIDQREEKAPA
ncbi:MAG: phenylacetate--CoA ligase [Kiritimatiellae bacterium]|nr:phenylacetate--CoA ligase [Kiritimatiellia bacterium]